MIEEMWTLSAGVRLHRFAGVVSNTYIIENRLTAETFLLDSGMPSDFDGLVAALAAMPEPAGIFCTHFHIDHIGGWFTLKKRWPTLFIAFSEAARRRVTGSQRLPLPSFSDIRDVLLPCMRAFGYAPKIRDVLCGRLYGTPFHKGFPAERVRFFRQGDPPVDGFEILATPGHTVDSVSFYHRPSGLLVCGDTFLWLDGRLQVNPFVEDAESQRHTVEGIGRLGEGVTLCPGHGRSHPVPPSALMVGGA
ncbi:MBL fold metallo-hydrolase [Desulfatirhabdium butyrativorans]|uniref:MBL fold metallo-hydrolase n=1 Tax=Desulfatirhabdium butyrativorans TaxID=340467 RepID=UPI0003F956DB|nr:MBL fold metallo-hydrolase [Desulfatirhabdium butyrativorans]